MRIGLDLDGTIITCQDKHCILMAVITKAIGLDFCKRQYWKDKRSGLNNKQALLGQGLAVGEAETADRIWVANIENIEWLYFDYLLKGAVKNLARLRDQGNSLHLISSRNNVANGLIQLEALRIKSFFKTIDFVVSDSGQTKADYFDKLNIDCYVGDTEADYEASRASDIPFYPVITGMRSKKVFINLGLDVKTLTTLGQFSKKDHND